MPNGSPSMCSYCGCVSATRYLRDGGGRQRAAERLAADLAGGRQVLLELRLADAQHAGDVVEAVARVVGRQQRGDVDVYGQEIPDRVAVLGAVEPVECLFAAGVRIGRGGAVELRFQPARERLARGFVRPRPAGRRHLAAAHLAHDLFQQRRMCAGHGQIERVEGQPRVAVLHPLVVAAHAVAVEHGARLRGVRRSRLGPGAGGQADRGERARQHRGAAQPAGKAHPACHNHEAYHHRAALSLQIDTAGPCGGKPRIADVGRALSGGGTT